MYMHFGILFNPPPGIIVMPDCNNQSLDFPAAPVKRANLPKGRGAKFPV